MSKGVITFALAALLAVPLIAGPGEQAPPPELILKEVLQLSDAQIGNDWSLWSRSLLRR